MIAGILGFMVIVAISVLIIFAEIFFGILSVVLAIGIWLFAIMIALIFIIVQFIASILSMVF